jgi:hypothetical protein
MKESKIPLFIVAVAALVMAGGIEISMLPGLHQDWDNWCLHVLPRFNVLLNFKLKLSTTQLN